MKLLITPTIPRKINTINKDNHTFLCVCGIMYGLKLYKSIDLNGLYDSIKHDLNHSFTDEQYLNKFDLVTDFGSCEHVFNIAEAYKLTHPINSGDC